MTVCALAVMFKTRADADARDVVGCGEGRDTVLADAADKVDASTCETIKRPRRKKT